MKMLHVALAGLLYFSLGCDKDACDPTNYNGDCSGMFSTSIASCRECPGHAAHEGMCTSEYEADSTTCQSLYGGDYSSDSPSPGGSTDDCGSSVWTCGYDGQATPMCQWACTYTGSERAQTCEVLASMLESGNAGSCCTVCR